MEDVGSSAVDAPCSEPKDPTGETPVLLTEPAEGVPPVVSDPATLGQDIGEFKTSLQKFSYSSGEKYSEFKQGDRPGVIPDGALYYHTVSVNPGWSNKFKRVATIGAHEFYSVR